MDELLGKLRENSELEKEGIMVMDQKGGAVTNEDGSALHLQDLSSIPETLFPVVATLHAPSSLQMSDDAKHAAGWADHESLLTEEFHHIAKLVYGSKAIDKWVKDPEVMRALDALDIDAQDHSRLSDILDPQNDGQVPILDLIDGIRRLRGFPRRSDIVCIDLMIRESQKMGHKQTKDIEDVLQGTQELQLAMEELKEMICSASS